MSIGQGNIKYTNAPGAQTPFVNIAGARNGTSLDTSSYVTWGQAVNQSGAPATLLNNREIPGATFRMNLFNGRMIISDAQNSGVVSPLGRLEVYQNNPTSGTTNRLAYFQTTVVTGALNSGMTINQVTTDNGPSGIIAFDIRKNNLFCFAVNPAAANATFNDPFGGGSAFASFTGARYSGTTLRNAFAANPNLQLNSLWHPNATVTPAEVRDIEIISTVTLDNAAEVNYTGLYMGGNYTQTGTGTGSFRGFYYTPTVSPPLVQTPIAIENTEGHVFLCNHIGDANAPGRVAIAENFFVGDTPTALLQIGPSDGSAGGGPLKLDPGTLVTVPENGLFEFDGIHLYYTIGIIRTILI